MDRAQEDSCALVSDACGAASVYLFGIFGASPVPSSGKVRFPVAESCQLLRPPGEPMVDVGRCWGEGPGETQGPPGSCFLLFE